MFKSVTYTPFETMVLSVHLMGFSSVSKNSLSAVCVDSPFCVPPWIYLCTLVNSSIVKAPNWNFRQRLQNICSTQSLRSTGCRNSGFEGSLVVWRLELLKTTGVTTELHGEVPVRSDWVSVRVKRVKTKDTSAACSWFCLGLNGSTCFRWRLYFGFTSLWHTNEWGQSAANTQQEPSPPVCRCGTSWVHLSALTNSDNCKKQGSVLTL